MVVVAENRPNVEIVEYKEVFSEQEIQAGVQALTTQLVEDFPQLKDPEQRGIIINTLFYGGKPLKDDVISNLNKVGAINYIDYDTQASSYGTETSSSGTVTYTNKLEKSHVQGRTVVILDDVIESGLTVYDLKKQYEEMGATVVVAVVVDKRKGRAEGLEHVVPDYAIFTIEDDNPWLEGYGMDTRNRGRSRRNIVEVNKNDHAYFEPVEKKAA